MRIPTAIKLHKASRTLELEYGADERYVLPAEFLRVHSPSAEVQGHGNPVLQTGKLKADLAGKQQGEPIRIDAAYVNEHLGELAQDEDLS
ncbi:gamma-butyrobetaine hydroxylase-like domain-containing protein, partial [Streptococcus pneumoniae]|uniref:gamma-butyrobetaine hydroxylase-like domain-containing protein n=1 Tax=Streptococcus pneumoniae TaxID=1313 RepID=UPI0018E3EEFC